MHEHAGDLYVHDYTLHAEPLNSVHSKEITGYMDEITKLIEEKVIVGDMGEEIILKNWTPAVSLYDDRTHTYIPRRWWPDWWQDRQRYVRRLGLTPWRTGLLLTSTYGQVCCEEQVGQTLTADKTVKNLTWLHFDVSPDFGLQLGRVSAVSGRIHRMLKPGHCSIDDDDEGLGDAKHASSRGEVQDGGSEFGAARQIP